MRAWALTLLAIILLPLTACGPALVAVTIPNLDGVTEVLGYSIAPTCTPEGFEFEQYEILGFTESVISSKLIPYASLYYERYENYAYHNIIIQYPQSFPSSISDDFLLEVLGIEWQRPDDAVSEVKVNGKTAYLVHGSWSAESLQILTSLDTEALSTYTPVWDYDMYLSLFFNFELSQDDMVGVMMRAMLYPKDWVTSCEMVAIAESFQRVD